MPNFPDFSYTCQEHREVPYSLRHEEKPLAMSSELTKAVEYLLWYVPNINSYQSSSNPLIDNPLYEDFTFELFCSVMGLSSEDVLFPEYIDDDVVHFYMESICTNCQKIIVVTGEKETKSAALLRHMRNAIAHGIFTVVEDKIMAFDATNPSGAGGSYSCNGIMKVIPEKLLQALRMLNEELTHEDLALKAFQSVGYKILDNDKTNPALPYDFLVEKRGRRYAVEIKAITAPEEVEEGDLNEILEVFPKGVYHHKVLLMDSAWLTKKAKRELQQRDIFLLDRSNLENLLHGQDELQKIHDKKRR